MAAERTRLRLQIGRRERRRKDLARDEQTLRSQAKALPRRAAKASQSREAAEVGANLVPTELSLVGWNVTEGRVPSLAKGANTTLRVRRWWAPSGQVLESVRTGTEPPFELRTIRTTRTCRKC